MLSKKLKIALCISIILVPLFSAMFIGCSGEPKELKIAVALLPAEQEQYKEILNDFTERTGIVVKLIAQQYAQIRQAVEAEVQAGKGELDVVELDVYLLPLLRDKMQCLDTLIHNEQELKTNIDEASWEVGLFGEKNELYYLPHRLNWQAMVYNSDILDKPPSNWEELMVIAKEHPGEIGLKCARYEGLVCDIFPFLWQAGASMLKPDSPQALKTMQFLKELSQYFNIAVKSYKENSILQAQEHKEIVLHFNWPFVVPYLKNKGLLHQTMETAPLPEGPECKATILGGGYLGIPKTAPNPHKAARLIQFLTSAEVQKELVKKLGWFPVRKEGWSAISDENKVDFKGYFEMRKYVKARPNITSYPQISQIWQKGFYRIVFEDAEPKTVLQEMQKKIDALLE